MSSGWCHVSVPGEWVDWEWRLCRLIWHHNQVDWSSKSVAVNLNHWSGMSVYMCTFYHDVVFRNIALTNLDFEWTEGHTNYYFGQTTLCQVHSQNRKGHEFWEAQFSVPHTGILTVVELPVSDCDRDSWGRRRGMIVWCSDFCRSPRFRNTFLSIVTVQLFSFTTGGLNSCSFCFLFRLNVRRDYWIYSTGGHLYYLRVVVTTPRLKYWQGTLRSFHVFPLLSSSSALGTTLQRSPHSTKGVEEGKRGIASQKSQNAEITKGPCVKGKGDKTEKQNRIKNHSFCCRRRHSGSPGRDGNESISKRRSAEPHKKLERKQTKQPKTHFHHKTEVTFL